MTPASLKIGFVVLIAALAFGFYLWSNADSPEQVAKDPVGIHFVPFKAPRY